VRQAPRDLDTRLTRWAFAHPWGYAIVYAVAISVTRIALAVVSDRESLRSIFELVALAFVPLVVCFRWLFSLPWVQARWMQHAGYDDDAPPI
jgi:hypothetical protein